MLEQSKDNDNLNDEPYGNKLKILKHVTPSNDIHNFKPFSSSRLKFKAPHATQCNFDKDSFEFILIDSFLNILNVKEIPMLGFNLLRTSMHFLHMCFFYKFFQTIY